MISEQFKSTGEKNPGARDLGELFIEKYIQQLKDLQSDLELKIQTLDSLAGLIQMKADSVEIKLNHIINHQTSIMILLQAVDRNNPRQLTM
jgi:hypothetical protein